MRPLLITAACLGALTILIYGWRLLSWGSGELSPEELAQLALEAASPEERQRAAVLLASAGEDGHEYLLTVWSENSDAQVRATCIQGLGDAQSYDDMDVLIDALADPSTLIRARAASAVSRMLNRELYFDAAGPDDERAEAVERIRAEWSHLRDSGLQEHVQRRMPLAYYYDRNTRELVEAKPEPGPIETDSGPYKGQPAGVRAKVFTCGACGDESRRFIGWLSIPSDQLKRPRSAKRVPAAQPGHSASIMIRRPGDRAWVLASSEKAERIRDEVKHKCSRGARPKVCLPGG
jgi:hypothetical protein